MCARKSASYVLLYVLHIAKMITSNPCGFFYCSCNVAPAQALVLRLKSLKAGVRNNFLRPLIRFNAFSRYCYNKIHKILRNHFEESKAIVSNRIRVFLEICEEPI